MKANTVRTGSSTSRLLRFDRPVSLLIITIVISGVPLWRSCSDDRLSKAEESLRDSYDIEKYALIAFSFVDCARDASSRELSLLTRASTRVPWDRVVTRTNNDVVVFENNRGPIDGLDMTDMNRISSRLELRPSTEFTRPAIQRHAGKNTTLCFHN